MPIWSLPRQTLKGAPIPNRRRLSQGDIVATDSGSLHVIWPPLQLPSEGLGKIREAIGQFERFIEREENQKLKRVYEDSEQLKLPSKRTQTSTRRMTATSV